MIIPLTRSLTLGGGYGYLTGRHGLTIDNLAGATVVVADGRVMQANKDENQDVSAFWQDKADISYSSLFEVVGQLLVLSPRFDSHYTLSHPCAGLVYSSSPKISWIK